MLCALFENELLFIRILRLLFIRDLRSRLDFYAQRDFSSVRNVQLFGRPGRGIPNFQRYGLRLFFLRTARLVKGRSSRNSDSSILCLHTGRVPHFKDPSEIGGLAFIRAGPNHGPRKLHNIRTGGLRWR